MEGFLRKVEIQNAASAEGLVVGFAPVDADLKKEYFDKWIADGKQAGMKWMGNQRRTQPQQVLSECRSIIVFGLNYYQPYPDRIGKIATYALGEDYHLFLLEKLNRICALMAGWGSCQKAYVDTGPVMEKRFAASTVLGWQGKNTLLISPEYGPWLFLGVILTTFELPADTPHVNRCGSCSRCMKACPTGAITAPYQLDARKCIAYWTIEHKGQIPEEYHQAIGERLFGCDECLSACPWNKFAKSSNEIRLKAHGYPNAEEIMRMDESEFERIFVNTPIHRLGLERLKRNALIVLENLKLSQIDA